MAIDVKNSDEEYLFPIVVLKEIFPYLSASDSLSASQTCRRWRSIGVKSRINLKSLRVSDFYETHFNQDQEKYIERPIFHRRDDLSGLILIRTNYLKKLLKWLRSIYPNITEMIFRNYVRRGKSSMAHPCRFRVFIINELMAFIGHLWSKKIEMLDVSGAIIDVRSLHHVKKWEFFRELRLSGADLSYNMLRNRLMTTEALAKTFWTFPLKALRLSNLEINFDMNFKKMTMFKAMKNKSLTTFWLNEFFKEAINLKSITIDCQYVHDETIVLLGNLTKLREIILRNSLYVNDFSPLGNLPLLHTLVIDFGDKGTEEQLIEIVRGSKNWRCIIFNELVDSIGKEFMFRFADHCRRYSCPLIDFQLNTEKINFPLIDHNWILPEIDIVGIEALIDACPLLEVLGVCSDSIEDDCLFKVAERCSRLQNLIVNGSYVTDDGVMKFFDLFRQYRRRNYFDYENSSCLINVRRTECTSNLLTRARNEFGEKLRIWI